MCFIVTQNGYTIYVNSIKSGNWLCASSAGLNDFIGLDLRYLEKEKPQAAVIPSLGSPSFSQDKRKMRRFAGHIDVFRLRRLQRARERKMQRQDLIRRYEGRMTNDRQN